ncbi:hypothetical protein SteCoe_1414 [Stentor coeruleus]|uniref:Cyclic nucleotide-binding domain-containing protein n=1 Tax=Stentor coeruleus TaxID=5963 RepID=A0A1R2D1Q6_9CILI|nr:hypothetical protein SteCoe_1414 [Stentor coeruleus]
MKKDEEENLALIGIEFDIFSAELENSVKHSDNNTLKKILENLTNAKPKYKEVWRRARMKLKFKSIISKLYKELRFFSGDSSTIYRKDEIISKLVKSHAFTETLMSIDRISNFMFHPKDRFREFWNALISTLLLYTATIMPLSMAFFESEVQDVWYVLDLMLDILFFCDILVTLNSAYFDKNGHLVTKRSTIFWKYFKSWFWIDLVSCIPFNLISGSKRSYNSLLRLARLPRLVKLLRLSRLLKMLKSSNSSNGFMRKIEEKLDIKTSAMRLFQGFMTAVVLLHLMACLWFYSARFQDFEINTWVVKYGYIDLDIGSLYLRSLYFIITTLATVGYGDIAANNDLERVLVIVWIIVVMFFMTFNISSMSSMTSSIDTKESILQYKISVIDDFCKESKLSKELRIKLKEALKYSTESNGGSLYNKQDIILELPKKLRFEVSLAMHKGFAREISFFQENDPVFVSNIIPLLISQRFKRDDIIYKEGDHPDEVYFIVSGRVGFAFSSKMIVFQQIFKQEDFGYIEFFLSSPRIFTTKAMTNTEVFTLKKNLLQDILKRFPLVEYKLKKKAENEKMKSLRNIIEVKVIFELKSYKNLNEIPNKKLKEYIKERFIEYQKTWRDFETEELGSADLLLTTDTLSRKIESLWGLYEKLENHVKIIKEQILPKTLNNPHNTN